MDYVYLKNVLLQFLEQKDKKHQMQLIPVLGMLLRFDRYAMDHAVMAATMLTMKQERRAEMDVSHHHQIVMGTVEGEVDPPSTKASLWGN